MAFLREAVPVIINLFPDNAASQSTLKFSGLKQPLFIISHKSNGHLCSSASLRPAQMISSEFTFVSRLAGGLASGLADRRITRTLL